MRGRRHPRNIHDALVRRVFSRVDTVSILLRHVLPPRCLEHLDFDTLAQGSTAYAGIDLERRDSDLLFSVKLRGTARPISIYVALDHQSTPDRLMPWRELEYIVHIWSRHLHNQPKRPKALPFILPIVLLQRRAWTTPTRLSEIIDLPIAARSAFGTPVELEMLTDELSRPVHAGPHDDPLTVAYVEAARTLLYASARAASKAAWRAAWRAAWKAAPGHSSTFSGLRGLPLSPATRQRILSTKDEQALERWFRRALAAASLDEIFAPDEPVVHARRRQRGGP